jgi:hypothetical protein
MIVRISKIIALCLVCSLTLSSCSVNKDDEIKVNSDKQVIVAETMTEPEKEQIHAVEEKVVIGIDDHSLDVPEFSGIDDTGLLRYVQDNVYTELVKELDHDEYFVENINAIYISKEYLEEVAFNSQSNVFFGYTLDELNEQFEGIQYAFGLGDDGTTVVYEIEDYNDTYEMIIKDVAIGTGVILICVTVSAVSGGAGAPAISMIFAASAKSGTIMALSSSVFSGVASGVITGVQTGDIDEAIKAGTVAGAEGFKWGVISGSLLGGISKGVALKGATLNGLTMNEAALIQKETGYPLDVIKGLENMEQYEILKQAGLQTKTINGKSALVRSGIDLNYVDEFGRKNIDRMKQGLAALDPDGIPYELHHIGQNPDSTLAILSQIEHRLGGNHKIWHKFTEASKIDRTDFDKIRQLFWKDYSELFALGGL